MSYLATIVKPTLCCGYRKSIGRVVEVVGESSLTCTLVKCDCGAIFNPDICVEVQKGMSIQKSRIMPLPPESQVAEYDTQEVAVAV
jgi:hypothetical protein